MSTTLATRQADTFADLCAKIQAKAAARDKMAADLAAAGRPVRLRNAAGTRRALAQADMSGADPYRLTRFDDAGPIGHAGYATFTAAIADALREGMTPYVKES